MTNLNDPPVLPEPDDGGPRPLTPVLAAPDGLPLSEPDDAINDPGSRGGGGRGAFMEDGRRETGVEED